MLGQLDLQACALDWWAACRIIPSSCPSQETAQSSTFVQCIFLSKKHPAAGSVDNLETFWRWDVSSNLGVVTQTGIFPHKKKMPNKWRTIKSLVHKIRLHGRRGKGTTESFSRGKVRQTPQKEAGEILCGLPPV